ncbi:MAG: amidohydrolase family protein [Erysipelotrichaceae bacterium]|nr:amidohydrolase family protein [Erysipelotrichaceae bacterium]
MMKQILIEHCELADFSTLTAKKQSILIQDGKIVKIADSIFPEGDYEKISAENMLAMPSFADCHSHISQSILKGPMDDYPITQWLVRKFQIDAMMTDEENYYASLLGCLTALKCGTTVLNEMSWPSLMEGNLRAIRDSRIRAVYGVSTTDVPENKEMPMFTIDEALRIHQGVFDRVNGLDGKLKASVAPAGLPAVSAEMAIALKKFADAHGILYHTHLAEGKMETERVAKSYGLDGEAEALYQLGILDPHTLLAHSIWLNDHELDLIKETGAVPVHCPCTNMKIGDGVPPIAAMLKKGIPVTFGCDGEASSSNRDMIREARTGAYLQKAVTNDPTVIDAGTVYRMMTVNGWRALGYEDIGELKEGNTADLILVDMDHDIGLISREYRLNNYLYAGDGHCVDTVILNGDVLVRHGKLTFLDEEEILTKGAEVISGLNRRIALL